MHYFIGNRVSLKCPARDRDHGVDLRAPYLLLPPEDVRCDSNADSNADKMLALDGDYSFSIILHGGFSIGYAADKTNVLRPAGRAWRAVLAVGVAAASVSAASGSQPDFGSKMPRRARCNYIGTVVWVDDRCQPHITWRTMKSAATDCHARAKGFVEGKPSRMASSIDPVASGIRTGSRLCRQAHSL
ncbi:hypothetical protein BDW67DRAFT_151004 [Aspergillus spinulosporus]